MSIFSQTNILFYFKYSISTKKFLSHLPSQTISDHGIFTIHTQTLPVGQLLTWILSHHLYETIQHSHHKKRVRFLQAAIKLPHPITKKFVHLGHRELDVLPSSPLELLVPPYLRGPSYNLASSCVCHSHCTYAYHRPHSSFCLCKWGATVQPRGLTELL